MSTVNNELLGFIGRAGLGATSGGGSNRTSGGNGGGGNNSWFVALSRAWGERLDAQATRITEMSASIGTGSDQPSQIAMLTGESLRMQFLSSNAATSQNSVGEALNAVARKQ